MNKNDSEIERKWLKWLKNEQKSQKWRKKVENEPKM